ncbi:PAS domain-containing protein [Kordiimonas aquimaris]|uniref:PAS domain-containing protein n=1 Tax=Kordiimonas aquimaris TaxID=707591 RepID=UPI0021CE85BE|nr:PAS domain-containing protein [Kordiimonas aquimaris]
MLKDLRFCDSASVLLDYWLSIKADDQLCPLKRDFSPMQLKAALPDLFLAEQHNDNYAELRVVGSNIVEITGSDKTRANVYDICRPEHAPTIKQIYGEIRSGTVAAVSEHIINNQYGQRVAKSLHLPLRSNDNDVRFVVGVAKALPIASDHHEIIGSSTHSVIGQSIINRSLMDMSVSYVPLTQAYTPL